MLCEPFWICEHEAPPFTLFVWDAMAGREVLRRDLPGGPFAYVALAPDGSRVAVTILSRWEQGGWTQSTLGVWETATGRELFSRHERQTEVSFRPACSPDGRWIVINPGWSSARDCRLVWLDARTGAEGATLKLGAGKVDGFAFSGDGRHLAAIRSVGGTRTVLVWEVDPILRGDAAEPIVTLTGHGGPIDRCVFSGDGRRLLTSGGGVVKLWDAASGREVLTLKAGSATVGDAFFSPDGHVIWGGVDEHGRLWGWDGTPVAEAKRP